MSFVFYKYQGTGNDFVVIDNRQGIFPKDNVELVAFLCDRKFGIGADGLLLLESDPKHDFRMIYFNADGNEGSMCGNGGRCIVAFAKYLEIIKDETTFIAVDGIHYATIKDEEVSLQMQNVEEIREKDTCLFMDTGSPHHVQLVADLENFNVRIEGEKLRYGLYGKAGSNINFVEQESDAVFNARTYERGVEDETLSCGTGVTAVALSMHHSGKTNSEHIYVNTLGGKLQVKFTKRELGYDAIFLIGPAKQVYKGTIEC